MLPRNCQRQVSGGSSQHDARIIEEAEASIKEFSRPATQEKLKVAETVAELVCHASRELHMKLIVVFTHSGFTARLISRYRRWCNRGIFSGSGNAARLALLWGVVPLGFRICAKWIN